MNGNDSPFDLPSADEPLILADGTRIHPDGRVDKPKRISAYIAVPSNTEAQRIIAKTTRKLADLPLPAKQMNAISAVLGYAMYGLSNEEIAVATNLSTTQVENICSSEAFTTMKEGLLQQIMENDREDVRAFFVACSKGAAMQVAKLSQSEDEAIALAASKDMLDRGGLRPADVVEHRHTLNGDLRIEYIEKKETPVIDLGAT